MGLTNGQLESELIMQELLKECRFLARTLECLSPDRWGRDFLRFVQRGKKVSVERSSALLSTMRF